MTYPKWADSKPQPLTFESFCDGLQKLREREAAGPQPHLILEHPRTIARWLKEGWIREVPGEPGVYEWKT